MILNKSISSALASITNCLFFSLLSITFSNNFCFLFFASHFVGCTAKKKGGGENPAESPSVNWQVARIIKKERKGNKMRNKHVVWSDRSIHGKKGKKKDGSLFFTHFPSRRSSITQRAAAEAAAATTYCAYSADNSGDFTSRENHLLFLIFIWREYEKLGAQQPAWNFL